MPSPFGVLFPVNPAERVSHPLSFQLALDSPSSSSGKPSDQNPRVTPFPKKPSQEGFLFRKTAASASSIWELARLSLASWIAQPESFPEIHKILFTRPILWPEQAKEKIALIIGEEKLNAALNDPEVNRLLASNTNDFKQLNSRTVKMPKLLIGKGKMLQGLMKDSDAFISAMKKTLRLK